MSGEDLRAILGLREESLAAELAAHRLDEVSERRVLGRARRARGVRVGLSAAAAAAAAAIVAVGVWALVGDHDREPLVTPPSVTAATSSASPTPTPSATPSPSPQIVFQEPLPADEFFLEANQLTEDIWRSADDGWSLTYWQPSRQLWGEAGHDVTDPGVAAIYLMDDSGTRYQLSSFVAPAGRKLQILAWTPTEFSAVVQVGDTTEPGTWPADFVVSELDLLTGELVPAAGIPTDATYLGTNAESEMVFQTSSTGNEVIVVTPALVVRATFSAMSSDVRLSPDGTTLTSLSSDTHYAPASVVALSASTGERLWTQDVGATEPDSECRVSGWATGWNPALVCTGTTPEADDGGDYTVTATRFYSIGAPGVMPVGERGEDLLWGQVYPLDVGLVACGGDTFAGNDSCSYYLLNGSSLASPGPPADSPVIGSALVVSGDVVALHEWGYTETQSVAARNTAVGVSFDITPKQRDDPTWWWTTASSVYFVSSVGGSVY